MGVFAGILLGFLFTIVGGYFLWSKGHLDNFIESIRPERSYRESDSEVYHYEKPVKKRKKTLADIEQHLIKEHWEEYESFLSSFEFSKDYDFEKAELQKLKNAELSQAQQDRDSEKSQLDKIKNSEYQKLENEQQTALRERDKTRSDAETLINKQQNERDRKKQEARALYDKTISELDNEYQRNRNTYQKTRDTADSEYYKKKEATDRTKNKVNNETYTKKESVDSVYYKKQREIGTKYDSKISELNSAKKKEILSKLTTEQKEKWKKFM